MKAIKLLCVLLALAMILSMGLFFVGCGGENGNDPPNGPPRNDDERNDPPITDDDWYEGLNFGGQRIRFLTQHIDRNFAIIYTGDVRVDVMTRSIAVDPNDDAGWMVNVAVTNRNVRVQDDLNVYIYDAHRTDNHGPNSLLSYLVPQMTTGTITDYDVIHINTAASIQITLGDNGRGHFLDLNELTDGHASEDGQNFIRPGRPWWDTDRFELMTYNGRAFYITGHLSQSWVAGMYVSFVNSRLWQENIDLIAGITGCDGEIHQMVRDGRWTMETIIDISNAMFSSQSAGDEITRNDITGLILHHTDMYVNMIPQALGAAAGVRFVDVDAFGNWRLVLNDPGSNAGPFGDINYRMHYHAHAYQHRAAPQDYVLDAFVEGNSMITFHMLQMMERYLQEMDDDFFIVPLPLLNEAQATQNGGIGYQSFIHDSIGLFIIPVYARPNARAITATLERMAELSYEIVTPEYLYRALAGVIAPAGYTATMAMLRIAMENTGVCQAIIWPLQFSGPDWVSGPYTFFRRNIVGNTTALRNAPSRVALWQRMIADHEANINLATAHDVFEGSGE